MDTPSETTLIHQAQQGDAKAFGQLYDRYAERVYRYLAFRLRDPMEAEDLTAETFVKAWQHIRDYRPHTAPWRAWKEEAEIRIALNPNLKTICDPSILADGKGGYWMIYKIQPK